MLSFPLLISHTLSVLSLLPLTSSLLSADHAIWYTDATWPRRDIKYLWAKGQAGRVIISKMYIFGCTAPSPGQKLYYLQINLLFLVMIILLLSSASVPDFNRLIEGGRGKKPGVWGEEHFIDQSAVARHPGQRLFVLCRIPQEQGEIIWAGNQALWSWALQQKIKVRVLKQGGRKCDFLQISRKGTYPDFIISV